MTPLMASLLRYLATAHVCDDVASADDFAELIQMLAGEVEELVHEAVPSSRPQNADGDGTDSVRIDEDEFHDVEEEAAAAARMQAIVRGRADRRRARRIKWRAQHTAVDEDEDEGFGLRRESFVIGSVMPTLTLIYQCHYVHVAALLHEDPSARLVPLLHELLAEGPLPLLLQASEPVRALLQAIAHGRGEGAHTDACGTQGGTQKAFMLGGLGGASDAQDGARTLRMALGDAQDGARTLRMALGPSAVLSSNDGGDGNGGGNVGGGNVGGGNVGGGNVGGGSGGDSGSVDSAEDDPQEQLGPFMDAFFAGDHKEIEGLVNVFGAGLRASLRAVAEHARRNPHDPDPMSSTPMPEVANTRSRMTRLLGMQVLTTAPPSTPLPTGGQHPIPHDTVARHASAHHGAPIHPSPHRWPTPAPS